MIEKEFNADKLFSKIIHYYVDKKGYTKETANSIAQSVIQREISRRICKNPMCGHKFEDHIRNTDTCLKVDCGCKHFIKT